MKLALGTAQFGLHYGIANQSGQVPRVEVERIIALARESGIDTLDTAIAYGESEDRLGQIGIQDYKVVTKLPPLPVGIIDIGAWVGNQVRNSLTRLKVKSIYGLLLHRSENLSGASSRILVQEIDHLKAAGLVQKFGVSIYAPNELEVIDKFESIDLVQAPYNIIDRRLATTGWLQCLHDHGIEVHVRSIFLQGLLLMPHKAIPRKFAPWSDLFDYWHTWLKDHRLGAAEACLAFAKSEPLIDRAVVGVESRAQLQELLHAFGSAQCKQLPELFCEDEKLINPSNWNLL